MKIAMDHRCPTALRRVGKPIRVLALCAALVSFMGCSRSVGSIDSREERSPFLKRAKAKMNEQDINGALKLYSRALEHNPRVAQAHLQMGIIYDQYREDYVRAVYHYERYLELRPDAEKRKLIEDLIRHARISYAASLPDRPSGAIEEIAQLKRENSMLRATLDEGAAGRGGPALGAQRAAATKPPGSTRSPQSSRPSVRTYRVQPGDTLSSIASEVYDDAGKWRKIYEANRRDLPSSESLRVGQTLTIP